jgi:hypothetical protein
MKGVGLGICTLLCSVLVAMSLLVVPKTADARYAGEREITCYDYGSSSITMDDVTWIFPPYSECTETYVGGGGGGYTYYDPAPTGGGGGGGSAGFSKAPNPSSGNPNSATCKSDVMSRYMHVEYDFALWKKAHAPKQLLGQGELIQFTYDDGGVELYTWIPGAPASFTAGTDCFC